MTLKMMMMMCPHHQPSGMQLQLLILQPGEGGRYLLEQLTHLFS